MKPMIILKETDKLQNQKKNILNKEQKSQKSLS